MAVVVQCFHCNAVLELDDGFRGGVCRCSGCGSLLQVPKGERDAARKRRPAGPPGGANENGARRTGVSAVPGASARTRAATPLHGAPAAQAADPGPSSSTLRRIQQARPVENVQSTPELQPARPAASVPAPFPPPHPVRRNTLFIWLAVVAIVVLTAAVVGFMVKYIFASDTLPARPAAQTIFTPRAVSSVVLPGQSQHISVSLAKYPLFPKLTILHADIAQW